MWRSIFFIFLQKNRENWLTQNINTKWCLITYWEVCYFTFFTICHSYVVQCCFTIGTDITEKMKYVMPVKYEYRFSSFRREIHNLQLIFRRTFRESAWRSIIFIFIYLPYTNAHGNLEPNVIYPTAKREKIVGRKCPVDKIPRFRPVIYMVIPRTRTTR